LGVDGKVIKACAHYA